MINLEQVSRKRNPIKKHAFLSILLGILIFLIVGFSGQLFSNAIKTILMLVVACLFIISLFIINYSYKFKKVIGSITFTDDYLETEIFQKKDVFGLDKFKAVRFKLTGYEGLNKTLLSYHSGINNFVYLYSSDRTRRFEFYIPNEKAWKVLKSIESGYRDRFNIT